MEGAKKLITLYLHLYTRAFKHIHGPGVTIVSSLNLLTSAPHVTAEALFSAICVGHGLATNLSCTLLENVYSKVDKMRTLYEMDCVLIGPLV